MKLPALIFTALLGTTALVQAQAPDAEIQVAPSPAKESKSSPTKAPTASVEGGGSPVQALPSPSSKGSKFLATKDPNMNTDGSVTLAAGPLGDVVSEIERRIHHWTPKQESGEWVMPNILYGPEVRDAVVPGALTLRGVSPLQALTLAAAAAGCSLEPIMATEEEGDPADKPRAIIGYRIMPEKRRPIRTGGGIPSGLFGQPSQPPVPSPDVKEGDANRLPSSSNGKGPDTYGGGNNYKVPGNPAGTPFPVVNSYSANNLVTAPQKVNNQPFVRVYALGSILNGTKEEVAVKEKNFDQLISSAMEKSAIEAGVAGVSGEGGGSIGSDGAGKKMPELSFHMELRALIVKGTAEQHEIVEQVIKALKENETPVPTAARR